MLCSAINPAYAARENRSQQVENYPPASPAQQIAASQTDILLSDAPQSPGPASGIILDLLFCLPALLILARRALDTDYRLLRSWSHVPMALLAILALCSPLWAADKFAALVSALHLFCAIIFLWSSFQLGRSWLRLRLVAGVSIGLLIVLAYVGYNYHLFDTQDLRQMWNEKKIQILEQHQWTPGSFQAEMFEKRVLNGQPMGFSISTNTYAALLVMLGIAAAGVLIQRFSDKDHWGWMVVPFLAVCALPPLIYWTACRAAYATPMIAAMIISAVWLLRRLASPRNSASAASPDRRLIRIWRGGYFSAVALIAAGIALLVHHGLRYGTLWHDSLTFRWRYWIGAYRILMNGLHHAAREYFDFLLGVGWENFGPNYLVHRLPTATEEIRDPHNFIVRVFIELGIIGGILLIAWMLRLWWELTRPALPDSTKDIHGAANPYDQATALLIIISVGVIAVVINILASIDFSMQGEAIFVEIFRRLLYNL